MSEKTAKKKERTLDEIFDDLAQAHNENSAAFEAMQLAQDSEDRAQRKVRELNDELKKHNKDEISRRLESL